MCLTVLQVMVWGDMVFSAHWVTEGTGTIVSQWRCGACSNENPCPEHGIRCWTKWFMELLFLLPVGPMFLVSPLPYIHQTYSGKCGARLLIWITVIFVHFHIGASEHLKCKTTQNIWTIWQYMESKTLSCSRTDPKEKKTWSTTESWRAGLSRKDDMGMRHAFNHLGCSCRDGRNESLLMSPGNQAASRQRFIAINRWKLKLTTWGNREISITGGPR